MWKSAGESHFKQSDKIAFKKKNLAQLDILSSFLTTVNARKELVMWAGGRLWAASGFVGMRDVGEYTHGYEV